MSNSEPCGGGSTRSGAQGSACSAKQLIDRVQSLSEMPRPVNGYPLEWVVEAFYIGDITAITTLAISSGNY
jgi:hypothetical protein